MVYNAQMLEPNAYVAEITKRLKKPCRPNMKLHVVKLGE